ncbi:hypothetical protein SNEBB_001487 [Seison nebaliae]|nr:hypothetical protein SNEBB_001487 [Seison nebaliae]
MSDVNEIIGLNDCIQPNSLNRLSCMKFLLRTNKLHRSQIESDTRRKRTFNRLSSNLIFKPETPSKFENLDQMREYMEKLRRYYVLISRPRFG